MFGTSLNTVSLGSWAPLMTMTSNYVDIFVQMNCWDGADCSPYCELAGKILPANPYSKFFDVFISNVPQTSAATFIAART